MNRELSDDVMMVVGGRVDGSELQKIFDFFSNSRILEKLQKS